MALKDSFINLNKALRTTLQNVPAVVDTLIRGFDEIGDAAEAEGTYSTTERVVGKWTDGSTIYEKTINLGALPNVAPKTVNHGITNLDKVISIIAVGNSASPKIPLPYVFDDGKYANIYVSSDTILINTNRNLSSYTGTCTLRYTKSAANRAPENDTRNGGDEEPDVKTVEDPAEELKK